MSKQPATADELRACLAQVTAAIDSLLTAKTPAAVDVSSCPAEVQPVIVATNRLIAFVREGDHRYVVVTAVVLGVMCASVLLGRI